jgi:Na+/H+ antiporter NhaD/arsenite permease-like protein
MPAPPPLYSVLPFAAMLLAIAFLPLALPHWWEPNRNKLVVSGGLGLPVLLLYLAREPGALVHMAGDYVSFIVLLTGLYVIAGGILLRGDLEATPAVNSAFLGTGAVLASLIGTTGASMLVISNIGGMLTPLGDPPLFLGYLAGVPFTWTLRLWLPWLTMTLILLATYFVWDTIQHGRESPAALRRDLTRIEPLRIHGGLNGLGLAGVVAAVALLHAPLREVAIVGLAGISLWRTPRHIRHANQFTAYPMVEVAVLFLGIFLTMIPALELLHLRGGELGVREPWQFFWAAGGLSSFLDNAPTYLTFLALAQGLGLSGEVVGVPHAILAAISLGSVAMGANSYIGNAPNFMVKAIAEASGVRMPSFVGYMVYSGAVLVPLFVVVTLLFL